MHIVAELYNIFICMYILEAKYSIFMYMYSSWNFEVFFFTGEVEYYHTIIVNNKHSEKIC